MRILNAASRRALDLPLVHAEPSEHEHQVTLALDVNQKQVGAVLAAGGASVADVIKVSSGTGHATAWAAHPPTGVAIEESHSAARA